LFEILVVLSGGHDSGHVNTAVVSVFLHALASDHIKSEHVKMALETSHKLLSQLLQINLLRLTWVRL
jgi:gamma-glutamyl phosphate reductase